MTNNTIPAFAFVRPYDILVNIIGFQIFGVIGVIANVFILLVIREHKPLQTPCFLLICAECVYSIIYACGLCAVSIQEGAFLTGLMNYTRPRLHCYLSMALLPLIGVQGGCVITACVALDRLISIICPVTYRCMGNGYVKVCWVCSIIYTLFSSLADIIFPISSSNLMNNIECSRTFSALSHSYLAYHGVFSFIFSGLCVCLYAAILVALKWREKVIGNENSARAFLKEQWACTPTVKLLMIIYAITSLLPELFVCIVASSESTSVYRVRFVYYIGLIKPISCLAQIIGLYFGSSLFQKYARELLGMADEPAGAPVLHLGTQRIGIGLGMIKQENGN